MLHDSFVGYEILRQIIYEIKYLLLPTSAIRYCWHFSTFGVQIFKQAFVLADKYFFVNPQTRIAARWVQVFKKKLEVAFRL